MRLSTSPDRDDERSRAVLAAALAGGVELLDTADAYALADHDVGHNERMIGEAVGVSPRPIIVTKGGLLRVGNAWVPCGRARHLAAAARASRERLGLQVLDGYLLHAIDPRVPLATSVRALAKLRDDGIARAIGVSNVNPTQLAAALAIAPIDMVEVELHPWKLDALRGGLVAMCNERGLRVLAHRPLGGPPGVKRAGRDRVLREVADRHRASPCEVVLAWLRSLSPAITVLPGATRIETVHSSIAGQRLILDDDARNALAERFAAVASTPRPPRARHPVTAASEVVMILGMPGAGKSTLADTFDDAGDVRLNRDQRGGSLLELARAADRELAAGARRVIVDNTYPTRASRAPILEVAARHGATVRCIVVATPIEDAQALAAARLLDRGLPFDARGELRPGVQFRWRRDFEPPTVDEGFIAIDRHVTVPRHPGTRAGLIVELDHIVWRGRPRRASEVALVGGVDEALARWADHPLGATVWRPGAEPAAIEQLAARLVELIARPVIVRACIHPAGPPVCWCRKPLPGLGLAIARTLDLAPDRTIHLGRSPADRGFARRSGMVYADVADGWPQPGDAATPAV